MAHSINTPSPVNASSSSDRFISALPSMSISELSALFDALWQHLDLMQMFGRRATSAAFEILHDENDSRLDAVAAEMSRRAPQVDEHRDWSRTLANYEMISGG